MTEDQLIMIVPAAGMGKRMGSDVPKQFLELAGRPLFIHTLAALEASPSVHGVVCVVPVDEMGSVWPVIKEIRFTKVLAIAPGGARRQDSVANGIAVVPASARYIGVHDGVRSLITVALIERLAAEARVHGSAVPCIPVVDTIKSVKDDWVSETLDRSRLMRVQTPQIFRTEWIKKAFEKAAREGIDGTDDASLVEKAGYPVRMVEGDVENVKITTPLDLEIARWILEKRR